MGAERRWSSITRLYNGSRLLERIDLLLLLSKRGRVMSFHSMAFTGVLRFGSPLAGSLAQRIGARTRSSSRGPAASWGALLFASQLRGVWRVMRPIYREKGILAEGSTQLLWQPAISHLCLPSRRDLQLFLPLR